MEQEQSKPDSPEHGHHAHGAAQEHHFDLHQPGDPKYGPPDGSEHPELRLAASHGDEGRLPDKDDRSHQHQSKQCEVLGSDGRREPDGHTLLPPRLRHGQRRPSEAPRREPDPNRSRGGALHDVDLKSGRVVDPSRDQLEAGLGRRPRRSRIAHSNSDHADERLAWLPPVALGVRQPRSPIQGGQEERRAIHVPGHGPGRPERSTVGQLHTRQRVSLEASSCERVEATQARRVVLADRVPQLETVRGPREGRISVLVLDHGTKPRLFGLGWDQQLIDDAHLRGRIGPLVDPELCGPILGAKRPG